MKRSVSIRDLTVSPASSLRRIARVITADLMDTQLDALQAAPSDTAAEAYYRINGEPIGIRITPVTAGTLAGTVAAPNGSTDAEIAERGTRWAGNTEGVMIHRDEDGAEIAARIRLLILRGRTYSASQPDRAAQGA